VGALGSKQSSGGSLFYSSRPVENRPTGGLNPGKVGSHRKALELKPMARQHPGLSTEMSTVCVRKETATHATKSFPLRLKA